VRVCVCVCEREREREREKEEENTRTHIRKNKFVSGKFFHLILFAKLEEGP
jgi:hypothetical protein